MQWFDSWFRKQCEKVRYFENRPYPYPSDSSTASSKLTNYKESSNEILENISGVTIRMYSANGGSIIQVSHWDKSTCEHIYDTYVVTTGTDIGSELNTILVQYKLTHG